MIAGVKPSHSRVHRKTRMPSTTPSTTIMDRPRKSAARRRSRDRESGEQNRTPHAATHWPASCQQGPRSSTRRRTAAWEAPPTLSAKEDERVDPKVLPDQDGVAGREVDRLVPGCRRLYAWTARPTKMTVNTVNSSAVTAH